MTPSPTKAVDIGELDQSDLAVGDQVRAADIETVAAAAGQVLELPAGAVLAEVELEADGGEAVQEVLVERLRLFGQEDVRPPGQRRAASMR